MPQKQVVCFKCVEKHPNGTIKREFCEVCEKFSVPPERLLPNPHLSHILLYLCGEGVIQC